MKNGLRIEELSVGNYVFNKHNNKIEKVQQILLNYHDELSVMLDYNDIYDVDELQPIYIQDVIDKLGFEKKVDGGFDYYDVYSDEFIDVVMEEYTDGLYSVSVSNNEFSFPTEYVLISSIHELQNFLTMCNADLKIEL